MRVERGKLILAVLGTVGMIATLMMLCGCPKNCPKQHGHWKNVGDPGIPSDAACGQRIKFDNGETWIYPCWPQKNVPKCVEGCKP
jgi:hypothetical protein